MRGVMLLVALISSTVGIAEEKELTLKAEVKAPATASATQTAAQTDATTSEPTATQTEVKVEAASSVNAVSGSNQQAPAQVQEGFSNQVCKNGKLVRRVELSGSAPCEVHYKKETEQPGHDQVLWSSPNNQAYCVTNAKAFVDKLVSMGWTCTAN